MAIIEKRIHLFPSRTQQLSSSSPMVLGPQGPGRVGRSQLVFRSSSTAEQPAVNRQVVGSSPTFGASQWAHSSAGRAPALQAGGHRFEPCWAHQIQYGYYREEDTPVPIPNTAVKLFIADGTRTAGSRESRTQPIDSLKESRVVRQFSWLECQPVTLEVEGSSPFRIANYIHWKISSDLDIMLAWLNGRAADL